MPDKKRKARMFKCPVCGADEYCRFCGSTLWVWSEHSRAWKCARCGIIKSEAMTAITHDERLHRERK